MSSYHLRLFFAGIGRAEQFDRFLRMDASKVKEQAEKQDRRKDQRGYFDSVAEYVEAVVHVKAHDFIEQKRDQLLKSNAEYDSASDAEESGERRLPAENPRDVPFFHAEDMIKTKFAGSPLHQKAVGVE